MGYGDFLYFMYSAAKTMKQKLEIKETTCTGEDLTIVLCTMAKLYIRNFRVLIIEK